MKSSKINVLVTGVGAIIGYGIIKNLKKSKYDCNIVGIDIFNDAVGQKWCDKFIQGERASSDQFINFLNELIIEEKIDLVLPGIEQDLKSMVENFSLLTHENVKYALNNQTLFSIFYDKKRTYDFLQNTVQLIPHVKYSEELYGKSVKTFGLPFILKQDISYASKGVAIINDKADFDYYLNKFGRNCMSQKKLDLKESEFTCAVFGTGDGSFVNPICLKRELSAEGATKKATNVVIDKTLMGILKAITQKCNFEGPTNLQFIKFNETYLLLEINARISSSTSIREIFGVNEPDMCIDYYINNIVPKSKDQKYGTVVRYIEDMYFDSNNF